MPGRIEYSPKRDVVMRVEIRKTDTRTCGGRKTCFHVTRYCSHGCACAGEFITELKAPDVDLVKEFAPCGSHDLCIRGAGRDVSLVSFQDGIWTFEMTADLYAKNFVMDSEDGGGR
jgi:hypothetical protein